MMMMTMKFTNRITTKFKTAIVILFHLFNINNFFKNTK